MIESRIIDLSDIITGLHVSMNPKNPVKILSNSAAVTGVFGDFDRIRSITASEKLDFFLFTDDETNIKFIGHVIRTTFSIEIAPSLKNRIIKFLSHRILFEYSTILYFDSNFVPSPVLYRVVEATLPQTAIILMPHPARGTVRDEIRECRARGKIKNEQLIAIDDLFKDYSEAGNDTTLYENRFYIRSNQDRLLALVMEELVYLLFNVVQRDQILLPFVLKKYSLSPTTFARDPIYYGKVYPHKLESKSLLFKYSAYQLIRKMLRKIR